MTLILAVLCAALAGIAALCVLKMNGFRRRALDIDLRGRAEVEASKENLLRVESASARGHAEYEELLRASGEAILVLDSDQIIRRANESAQSLFRDPERNLVGRSLIQATLSSELNDLAVAAIGGTPVRDREVRMPGTAGHTLIVSAAPVRTGESAPAECLLIANDVTELRRLETIRRDFVGNVSHELRTPLASIRAMAETLRDGAIRDSEVSGKFLDTIIQESDRLTRIARDLLVLSAAESGPPETDEVHLTKLLNHVADHLRPRAEAAEIQLSSTVESDLRIAGSPDQLQQVFLNLVENAIKYTRPGGVVELLAERRGPVVVARIKDTGIGILSEHLPRIFERFYRVDKGRSRASGGTGLGLSIVKHIAESHGGSVSVVSEFNHGSTFSVTLPAYEDPQPGLFGESSEDSAPLTQV